MSIETSIRTILSTEFGVDGDTISEDEKLFSSGLLDSLSSLRLLMSLEQNFGVTVSPLDVSLDDVDTIGKITETVHRLKP
ncbi:MAG: phosphopantetheine-binding protein [Roseobacter sp.]